MKSVLTIASDEPELLPVWERHYSDLDRALLRLEPFGEERRRLAELEWYYRREGIALFVDVDELIHPLEKLWKWLEHFQCVMVPCFDMVSETHGVPHGVKVGAVRCGVRGFNIGWGHHVVTGVTTVVADDVVMKHLKYDDYDRCLRRRMSRPKTRGDWGEHWLVDEKAFRAEFDAARDKAVKVL